MWTLSLMHTLLLSPHLYWGRKLSKTHPWEVTVSVSPCNSLSSLAGEEQKVSPGTLENFALKKWPKSMHLCKKLTWNVSPSSKCGNQEKWESCEQNLAGESVPRTEYQTGDVSSLFFTLPKLYLGKGRCKNLDHRYYMKKAPIKYKVNTDSSFP